MTWAVAWTRRFEADLHRIGLRPAERVSAAVLAFAATGDGELRRGDLANERRLYVAGHVVHLLLDRDTRTVVAETVHRLR